MDRIIRMILGGFFRRALRIGVARGLKAVGPKAPTKLAARKPGAATKVAAKPAATPDSGEARRSRELTKRARQAAKLTRRLGR